MLTTIVRWIGAAAIAAVASAQPHAAAQQPFVFAAGGLGLSATAPFGDWDVTVTARQDAGVSTRRPQPPGGPITAGTNHELCVQALHRPSGSFDANCTEAYPVVDPTLSVGFAAGTVHMSALGGDMTVAVALTGTGAIAPNVETIELPDGAFVTGGIYRTASGIAVVQFPGESPRQAYTTFGMHFIDGGAGVRGTG